MAISSRYNFNSDRSDDGNDYKAAFNRYALFLIYIGQQSMMADNVDYSMAAEEEITGDLTKSTNEYINDFSSPDWARYFLVQEESPENIMGKKGKHRPRIDIVCILTARKPHNKMRFEAKRLRRPEFNTGKYVGTSGLGDFLSGNYAREDDVAGMLGYIQSDNCDYWAKQIPDAMKKKEVHLTENGQWQKAGLEDIPHCYMTRHNRPSVNRKILIYHLLLNFT